MTETGGNATSDEVIIRPNFLIPEAEKSEPLKVFLEGVSWASKTNLRRTYGLKQSNGQVQDVTVGYIFEPLFAIPDKISLSIKTRHQFFGMIPPPRDGPVLALISLVPLDGVVGASFEKKSQMDSMPVADLTNLDFIVMDGHNFGDLLNQWDEINEESVTDENQITRRKEPAEKMIFRERIRGLFTTHYCDEYFRLKLTEQDQVPKPSQHLAVRNQTLVYATPRLIGSTGFKNHIYQRTGKHPGGYWPPQLMRIGKSIYWSQNSGKELKRWKDSEGHDYHEATDVCDLKTPDFSVRRIAAADGTRKNALTIVVNFKNEWKILHFNDVNRRGFVEIKGCPFRSLDSLAVLEDVIYVMGNATDSMFPDSMAYYKDGKWSGKIARIRDILPTAFFPLNGRLYLFANGLDTMEVFDPQAQQWSLNKIPRDMNDICGFTLFDIDNHPMKLPNEA